MENADKILVQLAKGAGFGLVGKFAGRILSVAGDILAARILGPSIFGLYSIGWTVFRLMEILAPLGLDRAVMRFIPSYLKRGMEGKLKGVVVSSIGIALFFGVCLGFLLFRYADWIAGTIFVKKDLTFILQIFGIGMPLAALLPVVASISRAGGNVKYAVFLQDIGQPLIALVILGILYAFGGRLSAVLYSDIFSYAAAIFLIWLAIRKIYPLIFDPSLLPQDTTKELLVYSIPVAVGGVFSALLYWVDRIFVAYYGLDYEVGIYQAASQLSLLFAVVLAGLSTILAPVFSSFHHEEKPDELQLAYSIGNKWGLYMGLPAFIVLFISAEKVLTLLYGQDYSDGWKVLIILLVGQGINLAAGASAPLLVMSGMQKNWFYLTLVTFVVDILLNLGLAPIFGTTGIAIATSVSVGLFCFSMLVMVRLRLGFWPYDQRYIKGLSGAVVAVIVVLLIDLFNLTTIIDIFLKAFCVTISFAVVLYYSGLDPEDFVFIDLIRSRINKAFYQ